MDDAHFDDLSRRWATRRTALGGLLAGLAGLASLDAGAKRKRTRKRNDTRDDARGRGHKQPNAVLAAGKKKKKPKKCKGGTIKCGKKLCVTASTDAQHCGRCGNACGAGQACVGGVCQRPPSTDTCPTGQIRCGGGCVDPMSDEAHCGGCGQACQGDLTCLDGTCGCADASDTKCGTSCVDTQADEDHCGACGNTCNAGETCRQGTCSSSPCAAGELDCGNGVCAGGPHPCCHVEHCGGYSSDLYCDTATRQCRCKTSGHGICRRFSNGAGTCNVCCDGGSGACPGDRRCLQGQLELGCTCDSSGGGGICETNPPQRCSRDYNTDPRRCGRDCIDCPTQFGSPQICCNGRCILGDEPGAAGAFYGPCLADCTPCSGDYYHCCKAGPGAPAPTYCSNEYFCPPYTNP